MKAFLIKLACLLISLVTSLPLWAGSCWQPADNYSHLPLMAKRSTSAAIFNHNMAAKIKSLQAKQTLSPQQRLDLAQTWWQKGLIEGNVFHISRALQIINQKTPMPQTPQAHILRSMLNMSLHRYKQATENLKAAKTIAKSTKTENQIKQLHQQIAFLTGKKLAENIQIDTDEYSSATLSAYVQLLLAQNKPHQAQSALNQAIDKFNDSHPVVAVALHLLSAQVANALEQESVQLAHLNKALERMPNHTGALKALSEIHHSNKNYQQAINCLNLARETSHDPRIFTRLAHNFRQLGQSQIANSLTQQAQHKRLKMSKLFPLSYASNDRKSHHHNGHHHTH